MTAAVVAGSVSKRYGETTALDAVSLSVDSGTVFALVGPNGAGKTTLIRTLTGTTTPDSGTVTVLGESPLTIDRSRIGLLPQSFSPPERLTARELLRYYAGLYDDPNPVDEILSDVGLDDASDTWYTNLSGGQRRRACVGIALINNPEVLFLDEPTTGIDPAGRQSLWNLIGALTAGGTTIFLTTHYMEEAEALADQVGLLNEGFLVETGTPTQLIDTYGGGTNLRVEMNGSLSELEDPAFDIEATDTGIRISDIDPQDIGNLVALLEERGIEYESLTWSQPTLEDVYLRLTDDHVDKPDMEGNLAATAGGNR